MQIAVSNVKTAATGEVILFLLDGGTQENHLPMALRPAESFSHYLRDTNIRFSFARSYGVHVGYQKSHGRLYTSDRAVWTFDCPTISARCAYNPKRPEASRPTEAAGCVIRSRVGAVACVSGHTVQSPDAADPPPDDEVPTSTHLADNLNLARQGAEWIQPTRNFTHPVLRENPQLAVQCPCSSRRLNSKVSPVSGEFHVIGSCPASSLWDAKNCVQGVLDLTPLLRTHRAPRRNMMILSQLFGARAVLVQHTCPSTPPSSHRPFRGAAPERACQRPR
jgi:hypothetical protein